MTTGYRTLRASLASLLVCAAAACGGGGDGTTPPTGNTGSIAVAVSTASGVVTGTGAVNVTVTATRSGGFAGTVSLTLEGAPSGVTAAFAPASLGASVTTSTLTLTVGTGVAAGAYPVTIRATGSGVTAATASYTLNVQDAAVVPGFTLAVNPGSVSVVQGGTGTATITFTRNTGYTGEIALAVGGVPLDVQASPTPNLTTGSTATINISAQLTAAPGTYPLTIIAAASGLTDRTATLSLVIAPQPPAGTITLAPSSVSVVQGQAATVGVTIAREAGVTGDVTMSVDNLPSGITASYAPNPVTGNATTLTLNASASHPSGTITVQVRATIGQRSTTVPLVITTTTFTPKDFGIAVNPTALAVTAGNGGTAAISISRTGEYTGAVSFVVTGTPAGATATVNPSPTTANAATLNITTTGATAPGTYPLTISATGVDVTGVRNANLTLTVNGFGGGNIQWRFCAPNREPVWFGVRTGGGAWSQVAKGANVTYNVPFNADGQVAYVIPSGAGYNVTVLALTPQEALVLAANECLDSPATKTISGTVSNAPDSRGTLMLMGGASVFSPPLTPNYTLPGVGDGVKDLLAFTAYQETGMIIDLTRGIIRRDINPAPGSVQPVLNFDGAESFSVNVFGENFQNTNGESFSTIMSYRTSNGLVGTYFLDLQKTATNRFIYGIPTAFRRASDLHQLFAFTDNLTSPRQILRYTNNLTGPVDPAFGALLDPPTVTVVSSAPVQLRATGAWQADYGTAGTASFVQTTGARSVTVTGTRAALGGGANYVFEIPDFTGAPGWNPIYMLQAGVATSHTVSLTGIKSGGSLVPADGTDLLSAQRLGTITP